MPRQRSRGQTQAYLPLAQLAERRKDFVGAEHWLGRIDNTDDLVGAQTRRAALLARQGKLPQARELVRGLPERTADEKKQKFLAEVQLLRDAKQYQAAYDMLAEASTATPQDTDLIYDRAMVAEKLNRLDEMERLLRRLIELKPDNQNAYNALGYSLADRKVRLEEARTLIRKAVQLAPEDPFIADSLGWVEFRLGNIGRGPCASSKRPTSAGPTRRSARISAKFSGPRASGIARFPSGRRRTWSIPTTRRCRKRSSACA